MHALIVYVPLTHANAVRKALGDAGSGKIGNYEHCSFSSKGTGRFRPLKGANPHVGDIGALDLVEEERIEVIIPNDVPLKSVIDALRKAHPYEEPAFHLIKLVDENML
jgi:hypothetical protein